MQIGVENPLAGAQGRVALLRSLGASLGSNQGIFGESERLGNIVGKSNNPNPPYLYNE